MKNSITCKKKEFKISTWKFEEMTTRRLKQLEALREGWDSYGARPIGKVALTRTRVLLRSIFQGIKRTDLRHLFIAPLPSGGIQLELITKSGKELFIELPPSTTDKPTFLLIDPLVAGEEREIEGSIEDQHSLDVLHFIED